MNFTYFYVAVLSVFKDPIKKVKSQYSQPLKFLAYQYVTIVPYLIGVRIESIEVRLSNLEHRICCLEAALKQPFSAKSFALTWPDGSYLNPQSHFGYATT